MIHRIAQGFDRPAVRGMATGLIFIGFFSALWGFISAGYLSGAAKALLMVLAGLIAVGFVGIGIWMLTGAQSTPDPYVGYAEPSGEEKKTWTDFGLVFVVEMVLVMLAAVVLGRLHRPQMITPVIALIVGLHFLPLAQVFRFRLFITTGALLCAVAVIAMAALLIGLYPAGWSPFSWSLAAGIGATLILWGTGFAMLGMILDLRGLRYRRL